MAALRIDFTDRRGIVPAGCPAPLMSPATGLRPMAPPLLRYAGHPTDTISTVGGMRGVPCHWRFKPGTAGAGRSEVKEEEWAQPIPGDMSGARHPPSLARANAATPQAEHNNHV